MLKRTKPSSLSARGPFYFYKHVVSVSANSPVSGRATQCTLLFLGSDPGGVTEPGSSQHAVLYCGETPDQPFLLPSSVAGGTPRCLLGHQQPRAAQQLFHESWAEEHRSRTSVPQTGGEIFPSWPGLVWGNRGVLCQQGTGFGSVRESLSPRRVTSTRPEHGRTCTSTPPQVCRHTGMFGG